MNNVEHGGNFHAHSSSMKAAPIMRLARQTILHFRLPSNALDHKKNMSVAHSVFEPTIWQPVSEMSLSMQGYCIRPHLSVESEADCSTFRREEERLSADF